MGFSLTAFHSSTSSVPPTMDPSSQEELERNRTSNDHVESEEHLKKKRKRRRVSQELLETEITYVDNLNLLKEAFYEPLHKNSLDQTAAVISTDDVRNIFGSLNIILPVNKLLLQELRTRLQVPESDYLQIGEAFQTLAYGLKSYTAYCNDYETARQILGRLKKNPDFVVFFEKISQNEKLRGRTIFDFMILPVQRIPRYRMLLQEMLKNTWESHPDYPSLSDACNNISTTAQSVEDSQEKFANINKIVAIQQDLRLPKKMEKEIGTLLQADRKFVTEGVFRCSENEEQDTHSRKLILFNDMLLVAKIILEKKKEVFRVKRLVNLKEVTNIMKSSSVETQPSLSIFVTEYQLNLHIKKQKDLDEWHMHLISSRTYALQKQKMSERLAKPTLKRDNRWQSLKRKRSPSSPSIPTTPRSGDREVVVLNPLHGLAKSTLNRKMSVQLVMDEVKKSPSMNAIEHPRKPRKSGLPTMESESGDNVRAVCGTVEKRNAMSRSTSVNFNKIAPRPKPPTTSQTPRDTFDL